MSQTGRKRLKSAARLPPDLNVWQWCEKNLDYSRVSAYDTEYRGKYFADYMPYWKEPMEMATSPNIREVWVLKCSRGGGSENLLLGTLRYHLCVAPCPILYISGQQESVEKFFEQRVKMGMSLSPALETIYKTARVREHEIMFPSCDLIATWPKNKMAFKQSGYALVIADEISTWPDYAADMLRERMANYSFPHLLGISSPDPMSKRASEDDPIFVEYLKTDQRKWMMPDPITGNLFTWELGGKNVAYGLKWDESAKAPDGKWNLRKVMDTAHYVTPDGTIITDKTRNTVTGTGRWTATATGLPERVGYHVTRFMVPFKAGSFAHIAVKFLEAATYGT